MAFNTFIFVFLLLSPAVLGQTSGPIKSNQDNKSQVPNFPDQHIIKVISDDLHNENVDEAAIIKATEESIRNEPDIVDLATKLPVPSENVAVTSLPIVGKDSVKQQTDESILVAQTSAPLKDDGVTSDSVAVPVKLNQVPIFLNQHMFSVIANGMAKKENAGTKMQEQSTEIVPVKDHPVVQNQMPIFMNQHMIKDIVDMQNAAKESVEAIEANTPTSTIDIPEPKDQYKNNIFLEGHHHDSHVHHHVMTLLSSAMSQQLSFGTEQVNVYPISTTYEYTSSGFQVTNIEYAVSYNGRVLAEYEVTKTLSKYRPSQYLTDGLNKMHIKQHPLDEIQFQTPKPMHEKNKYLAPAIATLGTLFTIALLLILTVVIYVKRTKKSPPKGKDKKELMKYILEADKKAERRGFKTVEPVKPPPYVENPAYEV